MENEIIDNLTALLNNPQGVSIEPLPPFVKDGVNHCICIAINYKDETISIHHHTNAVDETDKEKLRNPKDTKTLTFPFGSLMWIAPVLERHREYLKVESGYEKFTK